RISFEVEETGTMKYQLAFRWALFAFIAGLGVAANAQAPQSFPSAADLAVTINAKVSSGSTTSTLAYTYVIANSSTSRQALAQWAILYDPKLSIAITGIPSGWLQNEAIAGQSVAGWTAISDVLRAGATQSGFVIESQGLPGIVQALAMG